MATTPGSNRILIVEDDPTVRRLLTTHFRRGGFQVEYAVAAEEVASDEPYDVVLTDVHLPGESGVDLARRIRVARPEQPVVFVTGDTDKRVADEALETGAAGYLLKPFELFELDAVVKSVLSRVQRITPVNRIKSERPSFEPHIHVTHQARFVLTPRSSRQSFRQKLLQRVRAVAAIAAMLVVAVAAGAAIEPAPMPAPSNAVELNDGNDQPMIVPVVVDKTVYLR